MADKTPEKEIEESIMDILKKTNIKNAIKGKPVYTLLEMLAQKSITTLKELGKIYKISGYTKMDKVKLVNSIHSSILDVKRIFEVIYIIDDDEWDFFQSVLKEKHVQTDTVYVASFQILQLAGYMQSYYYDDKLYFVVPDEIKKLLSTPENTEFYKNREYYYLLNTYAKAATSLYGIIKQDDFVELFNSYNNQKTNVGEMFPILLRYINAYEGYCFYDEYIVSDEFEDDDFEDVLPLAEGLESKPRYIPSKDEFLKYADYEYYEITPQIVALKNYINNNLSDDPDVTEDLVNDIQVLCMQEANTQDIMDVFEEYDIVFEGFEQVQQIIKIVTDVSNNTRLWINNGHTPQELFEKFDRPNLKPLPNEPFRATKTGRNEPCPCGSGKKYKKCCGQ